MAADRQTTRSESPRGAGPAPTVTLERRTLTTEGGETIAYEIGTLFVPENRSDPRSRQIGIGFARLPSDLAREAPPTFHLVGGPGASHLGALDATTDAQRIKQRELLSCRVFGDVVIIDPGVRPLPGDFVVAKVEADDSATFKKYRPRGADESGVPIFELVPLNEDYEVIRISAANPGTIIGTMMEHRRRRRRR